MAHPTTQRSLRAAIERSGYYPELVTEAMADALAGEEVRAFVVHHEATFDRDELRRHVTVLVLTPTRVVVGHTDDHPAEPGQELPVAVTTTESVPVTSVTSVVVSRTVADPDRHRTGGVPLDVVLTLGWGAVQRLDLEPAACADPDCDADHGFTGTATADDLQVRVSAAGDGGEAVREALAFATALSAATAAARS